MPPSPGKIHPLPVKVLYNVDTSPQSYVTVLDGRQDVFVHPKAASEGPQSGEDSIVGSCYMKPAARGICYASPECIPNSSTLDFSVYNLDPSIRPRTARAFSTSASPAPPMEDAWTGKGFLSWVLSESANGTTLVKGRLMRDHDFSPLAFNDGGGLEGLMAAMAEAANRSNGASGEGADGKGWGLEVCITLRLVDPEGKAEFRNRGEFEDMLRRGTLASVSSNVSSSPSASTPRNAQRHIDPARRQTLPPQVPGPIRSSGPSSHLTSKPGHSASFRSSPIQQHQALPPPPPPISQSVSRPSQPSYHPPPLPSTTQIAGTSNVRQPVYALSRGSRPDPHRANDSSSSVPIASSSTHLPPSGSSTNARASSSPRSVTPPPPPQKKSPPPSTPSRDKLHALLRTDEKMSPGLARQLANHPTLLKLLKSVPASAIPKHGLGQAIGLGDGNAAGPSNNNKRETAAQQQDKQSTSSNDGEAPTPTPSAPPSVIKGKGKANASATVTKSTDMEGCCNCGITESELWRTKNMKDGSKKKVCNACGLYFNKNKRMRPPELWDTNAHTDLTSPKRAKFDDQHHTPVRSSPRLNRNSTDHPNGFQHPPVPPVAESPRKRQRSKQIPQPSPRMATRLSTRIGEVDTINGGQGKHLDFSENLFSPSSLFGTSPADALGTKSVVNTTDAATSATLDGIGNMNGTGGLEGEIDIEAFLAQFAGDANGNGMGFDLNALFANTGDGGEGNIMDLLNAFEGDGGGAQEAK